MSSSEELRTRGFRTLRARWFVWVLGGCGAVFLVALGFSNTAARRWMLESAERGARDTAVTGARSIREALLSVEQSARLLAATVETAPLTEEALNQLLEAFVQANPRIFGSAAAFAPGGFDGSHERFCPYSHRAGGGVARADLASATYRCWEKDWFAPYEKSREPGWTEPYLDDGGGNIRMVTYSVPIFTKDGARRFRGVVTADVSLEWLGEQVRKFRPSEAGYGIIVSRSGRLIAHPGRPGEETDKSIVDLAVRPEGRELAQRILSGEPGFQVFDDPFLKRRVRMVFEPIGAANWSLAVAHPEDELYAHVWRIMRLQVSTVLAGLVVLAAIVFALSGRLTRPLRALASGADRLATGELDADLPEPRTRDEVGTLAAAFRHMRDSLKQYIKDLETTTAAKARIEKELEVARKIQMAMVPKGDAGGARDDFELAARLVPARAVGGDLYAYFKLGRKLVFLVGDVSGKGVPAALFMARAKAVFETVALREPDLPAALKAVNAALCAENDASMFVTAGCAVLDLDTGVLTYTGAGHEPPILVPASGATPRQFDDVGGPVLGLVDQCEFPTATVQLAPGDLVVLFTDGVGEAFDEQDVLFGTQRLLAALSGAARRPARGVCDTVLAAVRAFAGAREQSDDITVLAVRTRAGDAGGEGLE